VIPAALVLLSIAGLGFLVRLVIGPTTADRVVALDGLLTVSVMAIAAYGALVGVEEYAAVAVVVALVAFIGTATFARFIERRGN
jgi:multisubunit Na+/H+ antiporter MnhF subunit